MIQPMKRKLAVGIYLAFSPRSELVGEGLARYVSQLTKALNRRSDVRLIVACPTWLREQLSTLLSEQGIAAQVEVCTLRRRMLAMSTFESLQRLRSRFRIRKPRERLKMRERLQTYLHGIMLRAAAATNPLAKSTLVALGIVSIPIAAVVALVLLPLFRVTSHLWLKLKSLAFRGAKEPTAAEGEAPHADRSRSLVEWFLQRAGSDFSGFAQELIVVERKRLVDVINRRDDIDIWFVPAVTWPEVKDIKKPYVTCLPDIVTREAPLKFIEFDRAHRSIADRIDEVLAAGRYFVTFSKSVAYRSLVRRHSKEPEAIRVIPHGVGNLDGQIRVMGEPLGSPSVNRFAAQLIEDYRNTRLQNSEYLRALDFESIRFLFYAAQPRPNKNLITLLKAYEKALRQNYIYEKLIITADLSRLPEAWKFLTDNRLQYDVIIMPRVSEPLLASLYYKATVAVCPSFFEGGFPFTFAEAMSVGTPALLARSPVVIETLNEEADLLAKATFDPFNVDDLTEKMTWAVNNRPTLADLERPFYERIVQRSWDVAAGEYVAFFNDVIDGDRRNPRKPIARSSGGLSKM